MDHDQRFKTLIREFFDWYFELFFEPWARRFDFSEVEWLDKEMYPDPPEGSHHVLDLVAKLSFRENPDSEEAPTLVLIHVEIESRESTTRLKPRLPYYYHFLRDHYQLPVLPIVIYLKTALEGVGIDEVTEDLAELQINRFRYLYVGLPGLDALEYLQGENLLGVSFSALMNIPEERVAWLGAEALRKLAEASLSGQRRRLLGECVEAYLPLDEQARQEFEEILLKEAYQGAREMNATSYEKGHKEGHKEGQVDLICSALTTQFGEVSEETRQAVMKLSEEEACALLLKIGTASSLQELGLPTASDSRHE